MKYKSRKYTRRGFLNNINQYSTGNFVIKIEFENHSGGKNKSFNGGIKIYDCRRAIELDLDGDTSNRLGRSNKNNSVKKMRKLAKAINDAADEIEDFWES